MSEKKRNSGRISPGRRIIAAMREAIAIDRGELDPGVVRTYPLTAREATASPAPVFDSTEVRDIRDKLKLTQPVFAAALNVSPETVKAWEQAKKRPGGPAARLLEIAARHPDILRSTLRHAVSVQGGRVREPTAARKRGYVRADGRGSRKRAR